jgi:hypothetical protein
MTKKAVLGWLEKVWFPEFGTPDDGVMAKVDTGADSGALHCTLERLVRDENGQTVLEFQPFDTSHPMIRTADYKRILVRSSNGLMEERHRIKTKIKLSSGDEHRIELTLADRTDMNYEVIIGRKFLDNKFLVDVSKENV